MVDSLTQMFNLFTESTGSVVYHLILVFSIVSALQSSFFLLRASGFPQARRTVFGLSFLLSAQVAIFILNAFGNEGAFNLSTFLPPADRALTLFALVWMIWLWTFPEPSRASDVATALVSMYSSFWIIPFIGPPPKWLGKRYGYFPACVCRPFAAYDLRACRWR
jgi:hypothetical protein